MSAMNAKCWHVFCRLFKVQNTILYSVFGIHLESIFTHTLGSLLLLQLYEQLSLALMLHLAVL